MADFHSLVSDIEISLGLEHHTEKFSLPAGFNHHLIL
jgi:hypothetical protein